MYADRFPNLVADDLAAAATRDLVRLQLAVDRMLRAGFTPPVGASPGTIKVSHEQLAELAALLNSR